MFCSSTSKSQIKVRALNCVLLAKGGNEREEFEHCMFSYVPFNLWTGCVCSLLNLKKISLFLQFGILEKLVTYLP